VRIEVLHDAAQADLDVEAPQRTHEMTHVALSLALVVGLGEALTRERLVGDLCLTAAPEGVVDRRAVWGPFEKPPAGELGRMTQLLAHAHVSLGIDNDRATP